VFIGEIKIKYSINLKITDYFISWSDNTPRLGSSANRDTAVIIHYSPTHCSPPGAFKNSVEISLGSDFIYISAVY